MLKKTDLKRMVPRIPEDEIAQDRQTKELMQIELSFAKVLKSIADFIEVVNRIADR